MVGGELAGIQVADQLRGSLFFSVDSCVGAPIPAFSATSAN
jgi:hypothetical protein